MISAQVYSELLNHLYDSVFDPGSMQVFLNKLTFLMDGRMAFITKHDPELGHVTPLFTAGDSSKFISDYLAYYGPKDFWIRHAPRFTVLSVKKGSQLVPQSRMAGNEFYEDFLVPQEVYCLLGGTISTPHELDRRIFYYLTLYGDQIKQDFTPKEEHLFRDLTRHLHRAFRIQEQMLICNQETQRAHSSLNYLSPGIVLLDEFKKAQFLNLSATEILSKKNGMFIKNGFIRATVPSVDSLLKEAFRNLDVKRAKTLSVPKLNTGNPYILVIIPISGFKHLSWLPQQISYAVFIADTEKECEDFGTIIQSVYGLSRSEAKLAVSLMTGRSLEESSLYLGVSQNTLKTQLKSIFSKTNTNRQSDLMRILSKGPGILRLSKN